jgi:hypothetical protein
MSNLQASRLVIAKSTRACASGRAVPDRASARSGYGMFSTGSATLATADAHGDEAVAAGDAGKLVDGFGHEDRPRGVDGMTQGDGAAGMTAKCQATSRAARSSDNAMALRSSWGQPLQIIQYGARAPFGAGDRFCPAYSA